MFLLSLFLFTKSTPVSTWLLIARFFAASFIIASKYIFVNLLNSRVAITPVVPGMLFSVYAAFVLTSAWIVRLVISGILPPISVAFVLRAALVARLAILGILFSIFVAFVLRIAVITKSVTLGSLFSNLYNFCVLISLFDQLRISLSTSPMFSSRPCLSRLYCVLVLIH